MLIKGEFKANKRLFLLVFSKFAATKLSVMENKYLDEYKQQQLRKCQLKQLDILREVDRICRKHGIDYWLDGGTLLGAVRHKGFIPWDDDIDIAMTAASLEQFKAVVSGELPPYLFLQTPETDDNKEPINKVRDLNSFYVEGGDDFSATYQKGLYIDLFPMVPYPTLSRPLTKRITKGISKSYSILHHKHAYSLRAAAEFFWFGIKYALYQGLWKLLCKVKSTGIYFSNIPVNNGYGTQHRRDSIFPVREIEFEGFPFPGPNNPDAYLTDLYRNYMEIPPVEKRKIHSVFIMPELIPNPDSTIVKKD